MHILVINGSPKGAYSITLQTVEYLRILYPLHTFNVLHAGQKIRALEKDFSEAKEAIEQADALLFSYPVYTFLAPSQLHRFIALMKKHDVNVQGKFCTQLTTSKRFYDVTAHRYVQDNCADMGMRYVRGLSADMDDLTKEKGRKEARAFFEYFIWCKENGVSEPAAEVSADYEKHLATVPAGSDEGKTGDIVIVTDCREEDASLRTMIDRFRAECKRKSRVVNLNDFSFAGGCLGCFKCAVSEKCVYKDGFDAFLRNEIQQADGTVYAFTVRDHSMGPLFKTYDDRQFCNGHRTVTMGKPVGYLVSGDYQREMNLQTVIEGRAQVGGNPLCGVAVDGADVDGMVSDLAMRMDYCLDNSYVPPSNFLGIGGMKVFRDLIWLMQGMMKADHKFYKAHGQYDFPQKQWPTMLKMYLVGALLSSPKLMSKAGNAMNEGMIMPYKKVLDKAKKEVDTAKNTM